MPSRTVWKLQVESRKATFFLLLMGWMALASTPLMAQKAKSSKDLGKEIAELEHDIRKLEKLLTNTHSETSQSWNELQLMQKQTQLQRSLVNSLSASVNALDGEIKANDAVIKSLEEDMEASKQELRTLAVAIYKANINNGKSYYIFNSKSVSQAYARMRYFKELRSHLEDKMDMLERTNAFVAQKKREQEVLKAEKLMSAAKEKLTLAQLAESELKQREIYDKLKGQENEYRAQLTEALKEKKRMDDLVKIVIMREKRIADSLAALKKTPASSAGSGKTEVAATKPASDMVLPLSKEFADNKGKLPWPIPSNQGVILNHYGRQMLPSGVEIEMNGIDIATSPDQEVRSVFEGKVLDIQELPLRGYHVVIGHGAFFTVYSNLREILVKKGQEVKALAPIGIAKTDKNTQETKVHFQVYQQFTVMDPETWLVRKD